MSSQKDRSRLGGVHGDAERVTVREPDFGEEVRPVLGVLPVRKRGVSEAEGEEFTNDRVHVDTSCLK